MILFKKMSTKNRLKVIAEQFYRQPEGHILMAGCGLGIACILWTVISWLRSPEYYEKILSLFAARLVVGRPGGVYFGHVLGFGYGTNIIINLIVDVAAVFFLYPLFVFSAKNIFVLRPVKSLIKRIHKTARNNYKMIKVYGIPGLFLFVLFPLWGTGPVVGSVIGYMMGLRPWFNMGVVLGATFLAIALWVIILAEFHVRMVSFSVYMPMIVIVVLFMIAISVHVTRWLRHKK